MAYEKEREKEQELAKNWAFSWRVLDVLIGGRSSIDIPALNIATFEEATSFVQTYGYNPDLEKDRQTLRRLFEEALDFIKLTLMPKEWEEGIRPPSEIFEVQDLRDLLMKASQTSKDKKHEQEWACAILRVIHTIAHLGRAEKNLEIEKISSQIQRRFERHIMRKEDDLYLGPVPLYQLEWKKLKTRSSTILKLLHKPENVSESIYDFSGMRIVTRNHFDVLRVLEYLQRNYIISFPNCMPSRARNTVVDVELFKENIDAARRELSHHKLSVDEFYRQLDTFSSYPKNEKSSNPHSAKTYRSLQITCRELVRFDPEVEELKNWLQSMSQTIEYGIEGAAKSQFLQLKEKLEKTPFLVNEILKRDLGTFFPFEIQITDQTSYLENSKGSASHGRYKLSQVKTARKRVLNQVLSHRKK